MDQSFKVCSLSHRTCNKAVPKRRLILERVISLETIKTAIEWMDILAASIYCCTSKRTIEMWIKEEGLRISRIRGKRLIKRTWLDEFLEVHEVRLWRT